MLHLLVQFLAFNAPISRISHAVAAVAVGVALPAFAGDMGAGEQIFSGNCAACHAGGQNVIMPDKTLQLSDLKEYLSGGANEKAVINQ